jgi:hypothetical protein
MARGYKQVNKGDYVYRQDSRCIEQEYQVLYLVFEGDEPVKVAVVQTSGATVARPMPDGLPRTQFWSLAKLDQDAEGRTFHVMGCTNQWRATDANGRPVKTVSFERMAEAARKKNQRKPDGSIDN